VAQKRHCDKKVPSTPRKSLFPTPRLGYGSAGNALREDPRDQGFRSPDMPRPLGALLFGAAVLSVLLPSRSKAPATAPVAPPPALPEPRRKPLFALIQTRPHVVVLAVSDSRAQLETELHELNATWNHWDLRTERHRYEIQAVTQLDSRRDETVWALAA
jgi:hypothetical protein